MIEPYEIPLVPSSVQRQCPNRRRPRFTNRFVVEAIDMGAFAARCSFVSPAKFGTRLLPYVKMMPTQCYTNKLQTVQGV